MNGYLKIKSVGWLFLVLLAGCNPMNATSKRHDTDTTTTDGDPVYRKNPHPTQAYRITMTIEDAPGPFGHVSGMAFYQMTNRDVCTPFDRSLGMSTKEKEDGIPIHFEKITDTAYVATIYADGMVDANYYGKGVCNFELNGVGITLRATGKPEETRFQPGLFKKEIYESTPNITYFWAGGYPKDEMDNYPDSGHSDPAQFKEELRNQLFKVTVVSTKEAP
ncbi:hypothetical protein WCN79_14680 [Xanthomonas axonopodis pv. vasculorum]|uniref:Uncharacterized protein n=1 Tax=Xanthomonas axonopodis pv. vasculorum TaxID=325777 RepID=A0A098PZZ2_9XANT|nr:hypothetical protein [Xanthomonas axonopodis]KGE52724.1 hypothetical protein GW15_0207240 [Xanthomonas axonopodis pv. vasculorum]PPV05052.1 hypothetical protein XavaCFBP5823_21110 [Xanthomonas axonopodis pv. vasculorum]QKD86446.1 hypothetical protein XAV_08595 [Xanthomonas axonopodis pv. vasculorum]